MRIFFSDSCIFFGGLCKVKGGQPERRPAPKRCGYARVVTCNAHHTSNVEGLMPATILGGLEVFNTNLLAMCQPLPRWQKDDGFGTQPPQGHQGVHPHLLETK